MQRHQSTRCVLIVKHLVWLLLLMGLLTTRLSAQSLSLYPAQGNFIGAGIGSLPDYKGSNDYELGGMPFFRKEFGDFTNFTYYAAYFSGNLLEHPHWRFSPSLNYHFGRDDSVNDAIAAQLQEIDGAIELGAHLDYEWIINNDFRHRFIIGSEVLVDVSGVSNGYNINTYARYWRPLGPAWDGVVMLSMLYGDNDYNRTYFSVSATDSLRSGLAQYEAQSGLQEVRLTMGAILHLSKQWHVGAGFRYGYLLDEAADSPLVKDLGSRDQVIFGAGFGYLW